MKTILRVIVTVLVTFSSYHLSAQKKGKEPEITLEQIADKCKGLSRDKRVTVKVARFNVSTKSYQAHQTFGDELATMLTSALQQTSCFRVLEMNRNIADATSEIALGQEGFTASGASPQAGSMLGAQLIVTGEITDLSEGKSGTTVGGMDFGKNQATVGFTLKVLNPQTGELLFSSDINMKGSTSGFKGMSIGGFKTFGSTENRAIQDATQKAIIRAVEILADKKDQMEIPEPLKPREFKKYNAQNCQLLRKGSPKVIILVTEATTAGTARDQSYTDLARREKELELRERENGTNLGVELIRAFGRNKPVEKKEEPASRQSAATAQFKPVLIEQTATETELTKHFVEAGFRVVDPKVYGKMNEIQSAGNDIGSMAALGLKMGANIIITGQSISERTNAQGGMTSCRARLEIKVIATEDGSILATNTLGGGGIDVSEVIANKVAIQNAAENMSQYLMERICELNIQITGPAASKTAGTKTNGELNSTEISLDNTNFSQLQLIVNHLKTSSKIRDIKKTLSGKQGRISIEHNTTTDQIAELLSTCKTISIEVTGLDDSKIDAVVK